MLNFKNCAQDIGIFNLLFKWIKISIFGFIEPEIENI